MNTHRINLTVNAAVIVVSFCAMHPATAQQTGCDGSMLVSATNHYEGGLFDQSLNEIKPCLPSGFEQKDQRISAYRLLALNYIVTDSLDQAEASIRQLLKLDSGYEPDPENDPPLFAEMVRAGKPPWYTFMWEGSSASRWAGRLAVVGTAVAIPLMLRDTSDPELPGPPAFPSGAGQ